jgi:hypothetical protein
MSERSNVLYHPAVCSPYPPCPPGPKRLPKEYYRHLVSRLRFVSWRFLANDDAEVYG